MIDEYKRCASWTHWIINYWSKTNPISKKQAEWAVVLSLTRAVWALLTIIGWNSSSISAYTNTRKHCQTTLFFQHDYAKLLQSNTMLCGHQTTQPENDPSLSYSTGMANISHMKTHTHTQCSKHCLILRFLITKREILLISSFL